MIDDPELYQAAFHFLKSQASAIFLVLSTEGVVVDANRFADTVIGRRPVGENIHDLLGGEMAVSKLAEWIDDPAKERLLHLTNTAGLQQSFYFSFQKLSARILAFGRLDFEEIERVHHELVSLNQDLNNLTRELHRKNTQLQYALDHVKTLQGIIPICMYCHKIRNDRQIWDKLEAYLTEHAGAELSHGICPECLEKHYPDEPH